VLSGLAAGGLPEGKLYDLGCGVGSNLEVLGRYGEAVGLDGSGAALAAARARGRHNVRLVDLDHADKAIDPREHGSAKIVLLADVLEHLQDERVALALADRLLVPGGALVATVPAFKFLWGPADLMNQHHRRYTRATLEATIAPHFRIEKLSYFNFFLFPPIGAVRALERVVGGDGENEVAMLPGPVNVTLKRIFASEAGWLARGSFPFGVSLLCVARKR